MGAPFLTFSFASLSAFCGLGISRIEAVCAISDIQEQAAFTRVIDVRNADIAVISSEARKGAPVVPIFNGTTRLGAVMSSAGLSQSLRQPPTIARTIACGPLLPH